MQIISSGKEALDKWKETYLKTREKIEEPGTDHRWEFDRNKLFKKTEYMSKICKDLHEIAIVLDQFYKFLGPELKEVTGDSQGIDSLLEKVAGLTIGFKSIPYVFEHRFQNTWDNLFSQFKEKVEAIENKATVFLSNSFLYWSDCYDSNYIKKALEMPFDYQNPIRYLFLLVENKLPPIKSTSHNWTSLMT